MAEILHFEILRKHGQTHKQTDMGITIPRPPPMGGEVIIGFHKCYWTPPPPPHHHNWVVILHVAHVVVVARVSRHLVQIH